MLLWSDGGGVAGGVILEQHHVFMYCAPTRASLLSGRYPFHTTQTFPELLSTAPDERGALPFSGLQRGYVLLPALLKRRGYSTVSLPLHPSNRPGSGRFPPDLLTCNRF